MPNTAGYFKRAKLRIYFVLHKKKRIFAEKYETDMLHNKLTFEQVEQAQALIRKADHIAILTHLSPDGDAMGSSLGMRCFLEQTGKADVRVIVPNAFPSFLRWMPGAKEVMIYDTQKAEADAFLENAQLVICTDFNEPKRIGTLGDKLVSLACPKIMIDHHLHPVEFADVMMSYSDSASASELVYRFIYQSMNGGGCTFPIEQLDVDAATCLYTGMMTDTGNFSFNSNHPEMYEIVGQMVALGVNKDAVYNNVFNNYSADRMRLMGYCLYQKMRIYPEYHTALIYLGRKELYRFNFQSGDAEGIVNLPLQIGDIYYSCFMREDKTTAAEREQHGGEKTKIKISLRSQGDRPVNVFAHEIFDGGGHANASGGEYYGALPKAVERFLQNYGHYFKKE